MSVKDLKQEVEHTEHATAAHEPFGIWDSEQDMTDRAKFAADVEHEMTVMQCLRTYWRAILWTVVITLSTTMESYDMQLIGSFYAYPTFAKKYGVQLADGSYEIPANWQTALSTGAIVGVVIGIFFNGFLIDMFGHKILLVLSHIAMNGLIFISFFAPNVQILFVGEILCGLPWGIMNTIAPLYAAECCPTKLRAYMATYVNLNWVIGHFIAAGVLRGLVNNQTEWSYRIPFAIQWVWPLPLAIAISFAPASPWWLTRKGKFDQAQKSLERLSSKDSPVQSKDMVAMIHHTYLLEQRMEVGTSYFDCFKGVDLRRTEIATVVWVSQSLVGFVVQSYNTYLFELAGLEPSKAYAIALGAFAIAFVGTSSSWLVLTWVGRRTVYLWGCGVMAPLLFIVGFLEFGRDKSPAVPWAQSAVLLVWFAAYGLSVGPVPYVICSEISASKLRTKTISIARGMYYVFLILNTVCGPYMLNPSEGNLKGKAAFPAAGLNVILFVWAYFRLPESKNRTFAELDILFDKKISARKFRSTVLDVYNTEDIKNSEKDDEAV